MRSGQRARRNRLAQSVTSPNWPLLSRHHLAAGEIHWLAGDREAFPSCVVDRDRIASRRKASGPEHGGLMHPSGRPNASGPVVIDRGLERAVQDRYGVRHGRCGGELVGAAGVQDCPTGTC